MFSVLMERIEPLGTEQQALETYRLYESRNRSGTDSGHEWSDTLSTRQFSPPS